MMFFAFLRESVAVDPILPGQCRHVNPLTRVFFGFAQCLSHATESAPWVICRTRGFRPLEWRTGRYRCPLCCQHLSPSDKTGRLQCHMCPSCARLYPYARRRVPRIEQGHRRYVWVGCRPACVEPVPYANVGLCCFMWVWENLWPIRTVRPGNNWARGVAPSRDIANKPIPALSKLKLYAIGNPGD